MHFTTTAKEQPTPKYLEDFDSLEEILKYIEETKQEKLHKEQIATIEASTAKL